MIEDGGCGACAAGSFKDVNGSAACELCPAGKHGKDSGSAGSSLHDGQNKHAQLLPNINKLTNCHSEPSHSESHYVRVRMQFCAL